MRVIFVSNMLNHHQKNFSECMRKLCDYTFVVTQDTSGWGYQSSMEAEYLIHWYNDDEKEKAIKAVSEADVVIYGGAPAELVEPRMKENKLSFFYAERFFKKGTWRRFIPRTYKKIYNSLLQYKDKKMYVFAASAYLPYDLSLLRFPVNKIYKWGYFPELKEYDNAEKLIDEKKSHSIIWVARFVDWKHPETAINIAKRLKSDGYDFEMNLIGNGDMFNKINEAVKREQLGNNVRLLGSMKPEQVREYMEKSEIHIFTSDRKEGWGAVLNESMNSACVPVANKSIGSSPYLIKDGENGFMYKDEDELYEKVKYLLNNEKERKAMAKRAYDTIALDWNASVAAERFFEMATRLLNGENAVAYDDGPCSPAKIFKDNWRK